MADHCSAESLIHDVPSQDSEGPKAFQPFSRGEKRASVPWLRGAKLFRYPFWEGSPLPFRVYLGATGPEGGGRGHTGSGNHILGVASFGNPSGCLREVLKGVPACCDGVAEARGGSIASIT